MSKQELFVKAKQIIGRCMFPAFTTIDENGFPQSRAMMVSGLDDDYTVYYITSRTSAKCSQIAANPSVSTLWTNVVEPMFDWGSVLVKGTASVTDAKSLRDRFWIDQLSNFFPGGPNDPNFVIIVVKPVELDLADNTMMFPERLKL
ncbi:MAG: pyridoxamine 5'-phosphate oxidase family protein [Armatimonadota bacterium]